MTGSQSKAMATEGLMPEFRSGSALGENCRNQAEISCGNCRLSELCLPIGLKKSEIHQLDNIIERNRPLHKGDHLYRQNDAFSTVFAVRSGSFKTYVLTDSGVGRVTGFYLPGEIIGMDGIASHRYNCSAQSLEHSSICEIPFSQLEDLSQQLPVLQHQFFAMMGSEIAKDHQVHTLLSSYSAEQRIASFLLGLSARYARVSLSATRFVLPMRRGDIGEYLGLTLETVSRVLGLLQRKELIVVSNREITLLDLAALRMVVETDPSQPV
ncbi:MAG: fumarate/nitrate reduction transcriptional regulator Fnr [Gammaproteobacteria bacterium]|nr:fumarate/nitrate reduction transcriptional regulator Fnr [Gammaproteobacteria bacterium]